MVNNINRLKTLVQVSLQFIQSARFGVELLAPPNQGVLTMPCYVVDLSIAVVVAMVHPH